MQDAIQEYSNALTAHLNAMREETMAKDLLGRTHYRLLRAKSALKMAELDEFDDIERSRLVPITRVNEKANEESDKGGSGGTGV